MSGAEEIEDVFGRTASPLQSIQRVSPASPDVFSITSAEHGRHNYGKRAYNKTCAMLCSLVCYLGLMSLYHSKDD